MQNKNTVLCNIDENGIAWVTLNKAEKYNAFCADTIANLNKIFDQLLTNDVVRAMVLQGNGKHFSAGADLQWMQNSVTLSFDDNKQDAMALAQALETLNSLPFLTVALVNGNAYGGALGLLCCCDIVACQPTSQFCFSEVKLGLIPATISPYVVAAIGHRQARRYLLSAETISAQRGQEIGLIHDIVTAIDCEQWLAELLNHSLYNCPDAVVHCKQMLTRLTTMEASSNILEYTCEQLAQRRISDSAQRGIKQFLAGKSPPWAPSKGDG